MGNIRSASRLIARLRAAGAREFCVCAGSRNSPLLAVLGASDLPVFSFIDERSAAFFALGRSKLHGAPVVVVTTSGTAVAELLPAAVEAHYSGVPLVLVTADRPSRFRGTGAPQSIEQVGIFGVYAQTKLESWDRRGPLHLNIEFDEPLIDEEVTPLEEAVEHAGFVQARRDTSSPDLKGHRPLLLIGSLPARHHERVRAFARKLNAPVFAEALSGLREDASLSLITAGERMIARGGFDSVIRIGGVPTLRFWRDLETLDLPVVHFSDLPFAGLTRGEMYPIEALPVEPEMRQRDEAFFALDRERFGQLEQLLAQEPESELALFRRLSNEMTPGARVFIGNSLPIREWDLAATREPRELTIDANRGANGIDGQLSTFFGQCDGSRENVCVVGDLTALVDLGAPWIVRQLGNVRFRIVIVNNRGGRIFGRVASLRSIDPEVRERLIENGHDLRFDHWAGMWGLSDRVLELRPDAAASARVWKRYEELWG